MVLSPFGVVLNVLENIYLFYLSTYSTKNLLCSEWPPSLGQEWIVPPEDRLQLLVAAIAAVVHRKICTQKMDLTLNINTSTRIQ